MRSDMLHFFIYKGKRIKFYSEWNSIKFGPASFPFLPFFFSAPSTPLMCRLHINTTNFTLYQQRIKNNLIPGWVGSLANDFSWEHKKGCREPIAWKSYQEDHEELIAISSSLEILGIIHRKKPRYHAYKENCMMHCILWLHSKGIASH